MVSSRTAGTQSSIAVSDCVSRGFKGLKQAIKLEFKLGRYNDVSASAPFCY